MAFVSVIIPTYNRALLIGQTLASVQAQTFSDYEVIVVDDGSTDATAQVVAGFDGNVKYIAKQNGGQASARNVGIQYATGEYVAFLDSDDLWLPDKLARQVACLRDTKRQWVYCDTELFDDATGRSLGRYSRTVCRPQQNFVARELLFGDFIASPTPVVRRSVFECVGWFDESPELRSREDWEMWLRIAALYEVAYVPEVLARYRIHSGGVTFGQDPLTVMHSRMAVVARAVAFAPDIYAGLRRRALANVCVAAGGSLVTRGDLGSARVTFVRAMAFWPLSGRAYMGWFMTLLGRQVTRALVAALLWVRRYGV